jgi:hypothetical protein
MLRLYNTDNPLRTGLTISLALLALLAAACSNIEESMTGIPAENVTDHIPLASRSNYEAEVIALCLSGELIAPQDIYDWVDSDLTYIRSQYGDEYELLNSIRLVSPWVPGAILIKFDIENGAKVANGTYHAWDSLNAALGADYWERLFPQEDQWWELYFTGIMHPKRLAELYLPLPGVIYAEPLAIVYTFHNVFPCFKTNEGCHQITYAFGRGRGDCWAGCLFDEYWYFVSDGSEVHFIGHWDYFEEPEIGDDYISVVPDPFWLNRAKQNRADFKNYR